MNYRLNESQDLAVESESSKILCLAGAGTGKTRTLIERIVRLVRGGIHPASILALTFTNAAAFEMRTRYREYIKDGLSPEFRTFHSYCYELLSTDVDIRKALGYITMPSIADDTQQKRIDKESELQSGIHIASTKLADRSKMSMKEKKDFDILNKFKKRIMVQENLITFDELCSSVCNLFIKHDPLVQPYIDKIKYLHVDEYQDTDNVQHEFVMSFEDSAKIFLVGDALQSLYGFRNANPSIIKSLSKNPKWNVIRLNKNYRSTKEICDFANEFSGSYADDSYRIPIESDKPGRPVEHRSYIYEPESQKYKDIFKRISTECKCLTGTVAIIARTNLECASIRSELDENGVQYSTNHKDLDARYMLPSVTDSTYMMNWLATFLPAEKYSEYIKSYATQIAKGQTYTEKMFMNQFGSNKDITDRADSVYRIRGILNSDKDIASKCKSILYVIGYPSLHVDTSEVSKVSDLLNQIILAVDNRPDQDSDVYVGTIHSVKGLEYDTVYVIGVNGHWFRLTSEENKNVYYVAVTRAKENLIIYS